MGARDYDVTDLDHDPEFDEMRRLGAVCGKVARALQEEGISHGDITHALAGRIVAQEGRYLEAALVIVCAMRDAGALPGLTAGRA